MIRQISRYCLYLVISYFAVWVSEIAESDFLRDFLTKNLITLLVALLAINTASRTALLSKLKEFGDKYFLTFSNTSKKLRSALYEQVALVLVAVAFSVCATSKIVAANHTFLTFSVVTLGAIFLASLQIIVDTGQAVLIILEKQQQ